jgi:putative acetyltransferase
VELRAYTGADAEATLTVFLRAIRETASADYSPEQVAAWAAQHGDIVRWAARRAAAHTQLAIIHGQVAGFIDLDDDGYIDMLFVNPDFGRQGVATMLLTSTMAFAQQRGIAALTTHASLTAKPFFERHGFVVTEERHLIDRDVGFTNYAMRRVLQPA